MTDRRFTQTDRKSITEIAGAVEETIVRDDHYTIQIDLTTGKAKEVGRGQARKLIGEEVIFLTRSNAITLYESGSPVNYNKVVDRTLNRDGAPIRELEYRRIKHSM